jgi:hypothetical protein
MVIGRKREGVDERGGKKRWWLRRSARSDGAKARRGWLTLKETLGDVIRSDERVQYGVEDTCWMLIRVKSRRLG